MPDSDDAKPLWTRPREGARYYQRAARRAALESIARGEKRILLPLATGVGKTWIAVSILRAVAKACQLRRALFLCDRDELRNQALGALSAHFKSEAAKATTRDPARNARVIVATYQTLGIDREDGDATFLRTHYPEGYFSHIIIDECHRSAWGKWSEVLRRNPDAIQIGLTATPRDIDTGEARDVEARCGPAANHRRTTTGTSENPPTAIRSRKRCKTATSRRWRSSSPTSGPRAPWIAWKVLSEKHPCAVLAA